MTSSTRVRPVWHPSDADVAFASGRSLKITRDGGHTWSELPGGPSGVSAIGIDPTHPELMLVGTRRGISRSSDGGKNWTEVGTGRGRVLGFHFDQTSPAGKRTCFAATGEGLFRPDDDGVTWRDLNVRPGSGPILSFAGGSHKESGACVLYCSVETREADGQPTGGIYRSEDRGASWTRAMGNGIDLRAERRGPRSEKMASSWLRVPVFIDPRTVRRAGIGSINPSTHVGAHGPTAISRRHVLR